MDGDPNEVRLRHRVTDAFQRHGDMMAVARSEDLAPILVEGARDHAIFAMDTDGRIASWNQGAERLTGHAADEAVGSHFSLLWLPEDVAERKHLDELQEASSRGRAEDENWVLRKDGSRFWATGTTRALYDERSQVRGFVKVMRDITRQHRAEQAAKDAHEALKQFQAMVAHEIRNPLSPMLMQVQMLKARGSDERQARAVDLLDRNLWRIKRLTDDLADAARLQSGQFTVDRQAFDVATAIAEAAEAVRPDAERHEVDLQVDVTPRLVVSADAHRVVQVLLNLLSNAIRHTPQGGEVRVVARAEGPAAVVSVRDNGIGLTPQHLAQLFQPFVRIQPEPGAAGMGLGLFLSRAIVERLDGRMWAESGGPGRGATFHFTLPLTDVGNAPRPIDRSKPEA